MAQQVMAQQVMAQEVKGNKADQLTHASGSSRLMGRRATLTRPVLSVIKITIESIAIGKITIEKLRAKALQDYLKLERIKFQVGSTFSLSKFYCWLFCL
jgi:hypothetical protein